MMQPDYPTAMGLLAHLNSDELKEMLNDDTKFDSVLKDVKQVKDWETEREMIIASNRSLAEFNLSKEPDLEDLKKQIQEKSKMGEELCSHIQELLNDYKSKSAGVTPDTTLAVLQTAAAESEEQSENIAQDFLTGKMDVDKFLEDFEPIRKEMHLRKFKSEKMSELLRMGSPSSYVNGVSKPYLPYPSFGPQGVPNIPYPVGPLNMPMPGMYGNHF
ncbi:vacuolar protein sorting-associated protein 37C [Danaus plexippus]|uniref:Vacuolar protein sorting 37B n=1 Tax=Danaus plexippus plexippus TaxID=278856 RepID=A0A212FBN9_DANPL|nr:vacuolar protein sorting-associated protein 37C [Danaus plexippus]XP_061382314.1 vacuolar protein sorting-associated protein 37C [Danaus plexippus]OWR51155.1 vacuolar protein sorting 37B [Danaus plexippus plexippus]